MGGLIYVVIMAVWAVVLVPAWLRRHDHEDPSRSVDRFTRNMRQLASRPAVPNTSANRSARAATSVPADPDFEVSQPRTGQSKSVVARPQRRSAAARRRTVLMVLGAALLGALILVLVGIASPVVLAGPIFAMTGFVVMARAQVRSKAAARRAPGAATPAAESSAASAPRPSYRAGIHEDGTWDATTALLPRYVTAPPASAVPRVIDTETPGAWTAAAMLERAQQERARSERMEQAKREAIARARAEQAATEARLRDEEYLAGQAVTRPLRSVHRRVVNE